MPVITEDRFAWAQLGLALLTVTGVVALHYALSMMLAAGLLPLLSSDAPTPAPVAPYVVAIALIGVTLRFASLVARDHSAQAESLGKRLEWRRQLLQTLNAAGPARINTHGNSAWWSQRLIDLIDALHGRYARHKPLQLSAVVIPLVLIGVVWVIDWIAGVLLLLATPLIPIFMILIGLGTESLHRTQQGEQASLAAHFMERLQALPWLRRVGATPLTLSSIAEASERYRQAGMRVLRVAFLASATLEFFAAVSIALLAIYVGFALAGYISYGPAATLDLQSGLLILLLAPECFAPLRQYAQAHHDQSAARAAQESLQTLQAHLQHTPCTQPAVTDTQALEIRDLHFAYSLKDARQLEIFRGLSFSVEPGEWIAVIGPSGCGKSTLLHLVAGFLNPALGEIHRPARFAWLGQQAKLLHGNVRDNLQRASDEPLSDEVMRAALADAGLPLPDPALPQGLDTPVGDGNAGLSGGQAQRVALARCLLQRAPLWLLDEPTAALDDQTRTALLESLRMIVQREQIAVVMATHDPVAIAYGRRSIALDLPVTRRTSA